MGAPTVTAIYPASGPSGGRQLVQIMGSNFQLPPDPPTSGPAPTPPPTVEVLFGGTAGTRVTVASSARLFVLTPITPNDADDPSGSVDVVVRNIDADGDVVPGETVTVASGYSYAAPDLNARPEPDLVRISREVIRQLKRQVLVNVSAEVHTDWSDDPAGGSVYVATLPALTLFGPDTPVNRTYSTNDRRSVANSFGLGELFFEEQRPPLTVDLEWDLVGVTERSYQKLALQREVLTFFQRNKTISLRADGEDETSELLSWEMDLLDSPQPAVVAVRGNSNVRAFKVRFTVRGFDVDDRSMSVIVTRSADDYTTTSSVQPPSAIDIEDVEQLGVVYLTGPSPGDES